MTPFIHFMRLRKIETRIECTIYRIDTQAQITPATTQNFMDQLETWRRAIPPEYNDEVESKTRPYNGLDIFVRVLPPIRLPPPRLTKQTILYYKCVRLLFYPQLLQPNLNLQYLKTCAQACAGVCESYKRLHRILKADYSPLSLQSLFLSGLTLIYCNWLAPRNHLNVSAAISDCNVMLYVMTERWPPARKYRDIFERIKSHVTDAIAGGRRENMMDQETAERCKGLENGLSAAARTDYRHMIGEMAKDRMGNAVGVGQGQGARAEKRLHEQAQANGYHVYSALPPPGNMEFGGGRPPGLMDPAMMYNLEDFGDVMTDWDLANITMLDHNHSVGLQ